MAQDLLMKSARGRQKSTAPLLIPIEILLKRVSQNLRASYGYAMNINANQVSCNPYGYWLT